MIVPKEKQYPNTKISIVLLTCNRKDNTKETIDQLYKRVKYPEKIHLIVVDNNSVDGTYKLLQEYKEKGMVDVLISSPDDSTISESYNIGFKCVESEYWIAQQDDITIPKLEPKDVIEQLIDLMEKYPKQVGIGLRIQRIPNLSLKNGNSDLIPARKSLSAYFRIQTKEDFIRMGMLNPKKIWDDVNFQMRVRGVLEKDCSWTRNIYADHSRGYCKDRGYLVKPRKWGTGIHSREHQDWIDRPYPEINPITNIPINKK